MENMLRYLMISVSTPRGETVSIRQLTTSYPLSRFYIGHILGRRAEHLF